MTQKNPTVVFPTIPSDADVEKALSRITDEELLSDKHIKLMDQAYALRDSAIATIMQHAPFLALRIPLRDPPLTWAIVHPFVKRKGMKRWQASLFDSRGPWSDLVHDSIPKLLEELFRHHGAKLPMVEVLKA
jgi:hypothetical protein